MQPIVKQPIHDSNANIWGYEILYSNNERWLDKPDDEEAAITMESLLLQCNSEDFLENRLVFISFTYNLLFRRVPTMFSPDKLVIQIDQDTLLSPASMELLEEYSALGYKIALIGFHFNSLYISAMSLIDYVKLSFLSPSYYKGHKSSAEVLQKLNKTVIAQHINTEEAYKAAVDMKLPYMQGTYIAAALPTEVQRIEHLPGNFFELMVAILQEEPDIDEITKIISRDVTLTYSLLKLVNSAYFSLRTRVDSVNHALMILGLSQLKQWIYLLSFKHDEHVPKHFIKLSLMRASFCEALHSYVPGIPISAGEAYLMGMFSTLDALLNRPLEDALKELAISNEVRAALLHKEGVCGLLYSLVLCYEAGDWHRISDYAEKLNMPVNVISQKYFECTDKVNALWSTLSPGA